MDDDVMRPSVETAPAAVVPITAALAQPVSGEREHSAVGNTMRRRAILWVDNVTVNFDGFRAINALTLELEVGELRCIIGPNGAGKTTLMDVMTGKTRATEGSVFLAGADLGRFSEWQIARMGIGRKFQRPTVFGGHTVFENLELAMKSGKGVWTTLFGRLTGEQRDEIERVLGIIHLAERRHERAGLLSHGHKQWLEIGMLLMQRPKVLLVDEPVAGMTHEEVQRTAELLVSLSGEHTLVVVEHDMDFVRKIARKVTVLHEGSVLAEGSMDQIQDDARVRQVYLGT
jgi:urea transport system ATP-binding protein